MQSLAVCSRLHVAKRSLNTGHNDTGWLSHSNESSQNKKHTSRSYRLCHRNDRMLVCMADGRVTNGKHLLTRNNIE